MIEIIFSLRVMQLYKGEQGNKEKYTPVRLINKFRIGGRDLKEIGDKQSFYGVHIFRLLLDSIFASISSEIATKVSGCYMQCGFKYI